MKSGGNVQKYGYLWCFQGSAKKIYPGFMLFRFCAHITLLYFIRPSESNLSFCICIMFKIQWSVVFIQLPRDNV